MIKIKWLFVAYVIASVLFGNSTFGQTWFDRHSTTLPPYVIDQIFRDGINVTIDVDTFSLNWGIKLDNLEDASTQALKSTGWNLNHASEKTIEISLDTLCKRNDTVYTFIITINGSEKRIDMKKNNDLYLTSVVSQLVRRTALSMRNAILREYKYRPDPEVIRGDNEEL